MGELVKEKVTFEPKWTTLKVKPIFRPKGFITDPKHEAAFLVGKSKNEYVLPVNKNNVKTFTNPFESKEEQEWLESILGVDLNPWKREDNFWARQKVKLGKDEITLSSSNPEDYIIYLILKANTLLIAPDEKSKYKRGEYKYCFSTEAEEVNTKVSTAEKKRKAYVIYDKICENPEKMIEILRVYGERVDRAANVNFLRSRIEQMIEDKIDTFLSINEDKLFDYKLLLNVAVQEGIVIKKGREYYMIGGSKLATTDKEIATLEVAAKYIADKANQNILDSIKIRLENSKE